jgi:tRNA pseudouridine55 synthase
VRTKRLLNAKKGGHTGTLDPFATGLLPLCFGEATKFAQDLLDADKGYETVVHLGTTTTTGDTEGEILETREVNVTIAQIEEALTLFRGEIDQVPPMYSALKRDGKPLYEYARAGIELERASRRITILELELLAYREPYLSLRVLCSKGTYIRVLGEDIGRALGCGAHLNALRRTKVGNLTLEGARELPALEKLPQSELSLLLEPADLLLSSFPMLLLTQDLAARFMQGQRLALAKEGVAIPDEAGRVRVYRADDRQLLGTGIVKDHGVLAPERLIATETAIAASSSA